MIGDELKRRAGRAREWLFDAALPLWAEAGFDARTGLFDEKLGLDGRPVPSPNRVRVQARQLYTFIEAGRLGWSGPWKERAEAGLSTLVRTDAGGGAVGYQLDAEGRLSDPRRDLYDQAFALYALAHGRWPDPQRADARISQILGYLETQRGPVAGYLEGELKPQPRRQNPHMHLFEAGIALAEAGRPEGQALAGEMAGLFDRFFFDPANGALGEYFTDDLQPAPGEEGRITEPGHHFEWVWLLERWRRFSGEDRSEAAAALWDHAVRNGLHGGVAVDETWREGGAKEKTARLWPQTERLKAALVRFEQSREEAFAREAVAAVDGLWLYFDRLPAGLWRDRRREDGSFVEEPAPASSFYHIILALSELMRVAAAL